MIVVLYVEDIFSLFWVSYLIKHWRPSFVTIKNPRIGLIHQKYV